MNTAEHVHPVERLDCYGLPFGHAVANAIIDTSLPSPLPTSARDEIAGLRKQVRELTASQDPADIETVKNINERFEYSDSLDFRQDTTTKYRAEHDILGWIKKSPGRDIAKLALWNVARFENLQTHLSKDAGRIDEDTVTKIDTLIDLGLFPKRARSKIEKVIQTFGGFRAMDSFESGAMNADAYCTDDTMATVNQYFFHSQFFTLSSDAKSTMFHERLHGVRAVGAGFFPCYGGQVSLRWMEEATVAHATSVASSRADPEPSVIDPSYRLENKDQSYESEKTLLSFVTAPDAANVPPDLLYEAFFSGKNTVARKTVEARLKAYFNSLYPYSEHAFDAFSSSYEQAYRSGRTSKLLGDTLSVVFKRAGIEAVGNV